MSSENPIENPTNNYLSMFRWPYHRCFPRMELWLIYLTSLSGQTYGWFYGWLYVKPGHHCLPNTDCLSTPASSCPALDFNICPFLHFNSGIFSLEAKRVVLGEWENICQFWLSSDNTSNFIVLCSPALPGQNRNTHCFTSYRYFSGNDGSQCTVG